MEYQRRIALVGVAPTRAHTANLRQISRRQVTVPRLAEVPWIGVGTPVAIVTVSDPDLDRRRQEKNLRSRFSLTSAESRLAVEILKGDGRAAAARRRGISDATAKTQLASIFDKTGTHRQAELIRLLLDAADAQEMEE